MKKSGLADSPFFATPKPKVEVVTPLTSDKAEKPKVEAKKVISKKAIENNMPSIQPESKNKDDMNKSMHASINASMHASNQPLTHDTNHETIIEIIRKAVKDVGKDSATYRFTPEEKKALLELSFSYKMQGYKTSENELTRIAINFLLEDHRQNGKNSILQRVLDALNK